ENRPHELSPQSENHSMADTVEAEVLKKVQNEHEYTHSEEDVDVLVSRVHELLRRRRVDEKYVGDATCNECLGGLGDSRGDCAQATDEEAEFV
ncbi:hypothetical protein PMAYCL1PPCAC_06229, partial [Pristionchus mayeri]